MCNPSPAARLAVGDLRIHSSEITQPFVELHGKGNKIRFCPLWASTARELKQLTRGQAGEQNVFLSRYRKPLTRFGIHDIVTRYVRKLTAECPELRRKRVGPHTIWYTTATHLLRAGVDINTIRAWLGHGSIETTNIYAEIDLEMKAKALKMCEAKGKQKRWRDNPDLLAFLAQPRLYPVLGQGQAFSQRLEHRIFTRLTRFSRRLLKRDWLLRRSLNKCARQFRQVNGR